MTQPRNINLLVYSILVIAAIASRFIPHPFNFTAVGAAALFSGAIMKDKRFAYLIPIAILFITDLSLGLHFSMIPVYGSFAITVWIGTRIGTGPKWAYIIGGSLISSVLFFLITNLPFWYIDMQLYPMSLDGTITSYKMALPFFRNQIAGDLFYNGLLFGIYFLITSNRRVTPIYLKK